MWDKFPEVTETLVADTYTVKNKGYIKGILGVF